MVFEERIKIIKDETREATKMYKEGRYSIATACLRYIQEIVGYEIAELEQKMNEEGKRQR